MENPLAAPPSPQDDAGQVSNPNSLTEQDLSEPSQPANEIDFSGIPNADERHLAELALILFDNTQPLHEIGEDGRLAIQAVAILANTKLSQAKKKLIQNTLAVVHDQFESQLNEEIENLVAATLAFYQKKIKRKNFDALELSPIQQRQILTLTAILQIATGLNSSKKHQTSIEQIEIKPDTIWIVVDGPDALSDATTAQHNTSLWTKIGYPEIEVLETKEAALLRLPFPEPQEKIGILPSDDLAEAGRKVMRFHFAKMLANEPGTRAGEDPEALHDMRVASRRLRAAFEVFESAFKPGALKVYLKGLRATGRSLGAVRDLDVFMEKASIYLKSLSEEHQHDLDLLLGAWQEQRQIARSQMCEYLDSKAYADFIKKFNVFLNTPGAGVRNTPPDQPTPSLVRELAPILIYTRFAEVRAFDPLMADATIEQLHALRIEFKKLRYTVEYFKEVLGLTAAEVITDIIKLQDHLGELNDAQVATQLLRDFIDQWEPRLDMMPVHERPSLEPLVQYLAAQISERHRLMNSFPEAWKYINRSRFRRNLARAVAVL